MDVGELLGPKARIVSTYLRMKNLIPTSMLTPHFIFLQTSLFCGHVPRLLIWILIWVGKCWLHTYIVSQLLHLLSENIVKQFERENNSIIPTHLYPSQVQATRCQNPPLLSNEIVGKGVVDKISN